MSKDENDIGKAYVSSYLLGVAHANMLAVQKHLTMDESKEALSKVSEGIRYLNEHVQKLFYPQPELKTNES